MSAINLVNSLDIPRALVSLIERRLDLNEEGEALRVELMLWLKWHMLTQEGAQVRGLVCRLHHHPSTCLEGRTRLARMA